MDFNQVRYFLALAETLNFSKAADKCCISQSALTQAIKRIENELDGEIITRNGKDTELTLLGRSLHEPFAQIERTRKLVKATAKAVTSGERAEINIGVMCTIGPGAFTGMLNEFRKNNPMVSIILHDVSQELVSKMLLTGVIDGVFSTYHEQCHDKLNYTKLFDEDMVVAFSKDHPFNEHGEVELREIAMHGYVDRLHCEFRDRFLKFCEGENIDLNVTFRSQREDWIYCMIRDGAGISVLPRSLLLRPDVHSRKVIKPCLSRSIEFVTAQQEVVSPAFQSFMALVNEYDWENIKMISE